ncbi:SusC/RagA family TonB-linked outer membrane protein [Dysgonomonas sp. 25]|uniref:SusC/RagA family TonB-linked outer membrane protein n=1 Tax=Dysgonomonas sp. 25 TaxID=2302933 RepID=UPI002102857C|nr:SusC/RagA family TonB-linked outer membrane protein [Dysgonomonas sp. 25]
MKKIFLWRRIALCLLVSGMLGVGYVPSMQAHNAHGKEQAPGTFNLKDGTLYDVIKQVESQSDYRFIYDNSEVSGNTRIKISAGPKTLEQVLGIISQDAKLNYRISNQQIFLTTNTAAALRSAGNQQDNKTITGVVLDVNREPLIGVSVGVEGTTNATMTDIDGHYTITAPVGSTLLYTFVGFKTERRTVGAASVIDIMLEEDNVILGDVVVTALGIKREVKALTYNVQTVDAEQVTAVKDANFINSLTGKVAGVTINQSASGIGGSSRVVMRGTKSLFGDNNALYVVDGVPILNTKNDQPSAIYESPDGGDGDAISLLNSDDIESISVLSGASAAALYGSQGANGVILVTTKKGEPGKLRVNYSNSTQFMSPFVMPEFQRTYGTNGAGFNSWGDKLDKKSSVRVKDFFQTGYTEMNSLSVSAGGEISQTYVSAASTLARGIVPKNEVDRTNISIRNTTDLIKNKLSLDLSLSYARQKDKNMLIQGQYHNPLLPLYLFPRGDDLGKYRTYEIHNGDRNFKTQFWPYGNQGLGMQNPYWIINRERFQNKTDRYSYGGTLKWDITDWVNVAGRVRMDNTENTFTRRIAASSDLLFASENGNYMNRKRSNKQIYADVLANVNKRFNDDFSLAGTFGASVMDAKLDESGLEGHLNLVPNWFSFANINMQDPQTKSIQKRYHDQTQAIFATAQLGYKDMLYLDVTARNEWASALAFTNSQDFFYPSVGVSGIITEMVDIPRDIISFMKLRGSYSEVGNSPMRYITSLTYSVGGSGAIELTPYIPATGLKPERTKAFEIGTNIRAFKDKINFDLTYYNTNTYNQLFTIDVSTSTGYSYYYLNAGKVNNWGIELAVGYNEKLGPVDWNTRLTYTLNRNKVKSLVPRGTIDPTTGLPMEEGMSSVIVNESDSYRMMLKEGDPMGDIYVSTLKKDHDGYIYVDPKSGTIMADPDNWIKAGNPAPKYNLGWRNEFSYKGFNLSFLIDARVGGVGVSATQALMDRYGVSKASAKARDRGGVMINGGMVDPEHYYSVVGGGNTGVLSEYVYSMTNVRLREATLGYTFPNKWFKGYINNLTVSVTGRNLFMFYNKAPFDPEVTASTGTYYQGFDYFMQPSLRSLGFGVKVQF